MQNSSSSHVRVAVTQAAPIWLDLDATVEKTCALIKEAAANGAQLVTFPECWIPGYPAWIWYELRNIPSIDRFTCGRQANEVFTNIRSRQIDMRLTTTYMQNSLKIDSPQMLRIRECAAAHSIIVSIGFSENTHHSLYISQATIGSDGKILMLRKKIKPTHMERTIFGDSLNECLNSVVDTPIGRVGALSCWEHVQPLLKYHTYLQREQIHVASWPPLFETSKDDESLFSMSREGTTHS